MSPFQRRVSRKLSFLSPRLHFLLAFGSLNTLGQSSEQIVSGRVVFWTFVGRPFTYVYLVVPTHSSESVTPHSSFQQPFNVVSEPLFKLVRASLITSTSVTGIGNVPLFGTNSVDRHAAQWR